MCKANSKWLLELVIVIFTEETTKEYKRELLKSRGHYEKINLLFHFDLTLLWKSPGLSTQGPHGS